MDNYQIKSVAFGGFDKQDVISYIEKAATEAAALQQELRNEVEELRKQLSDTEAERDVLRAELEQAQSGRSVAEDRLAEESAIRTALEPLQEEVAQLRQEAEALRAERASLLQDAQAYAQFREQLGAIECEARKRAADLEDATNARLRQTVDIFRRQYQILMSTFETTAAHVNSELRKVEVNLTQLPRAMDQSGLELNELAAQLEKKREN